MHIFVFYKQCSWSLALRVNDYENIKQTIMQLKLEPVCWVLHGDYFELVLAESFEQHFRLDIIQQMCKSMAAELSLQSKIIKSKVKLHSKIFTRRCFV